MDLDDALAFARTTRRSVMATTRRDGRPQLSNVLHAVSDDGVIRVSTTAARAKYRNLSRDPWSALHVTRDDFFAYAVLEGAVELTPVIESIDDPGVDEHVEHYRVVVGEHGDWDAYRASLVDEGRTIIRLTPTRAYGMAALARPDDG
jgi:PPOX class probable F420-dependent enzyme